MDHRHTLYEMRKKGNISQTAAFDFFDQLDSVDIDFMIGLWRGREFKSNHPMDGLLESVNWYGKEFIDAETVHPLVFQKEDGELYKINPGPLPLHFPFEKIPKSLLKSLFTFAAPLIRTNKGKARLRMLEYRGVVSATMIYDQHSVYDTFRRVDQNTVLGVMDLKGKTDQGYFFILERTKSNQIKYST
ncbi:DUF4334 domain-containing protein [Evansella sp. AB-rgal1]|uniref:DUF4334 domain-containing protein n=1 Tax=Evansella sp. AB-rgal1 TaxID=3242696 RepID=UPI00359EA85E